MTWDWSICLWPGWLLGLMGMLAVGFRIIPPWSGRFMALAVAAQVTRTELCGAHSPDGIVGRAALLPIIPEGKPEKTERCRNWKHTQHVWTPDDLTLNKIISLQYAVSPIAKALAGIGVGPWLRNKTWQLLQSFLQHGLATLHSSEKLLKLFPYVLRNRCCGVWITPTSFLRKWITLADTHVNALLSKREVGRRGTR